MITKAQVKHIRSLEDKKYRNECKEFVVEGEKMVAELLSSKFVIKQMFATKDWILTNINVSNCAIQEIELFELEKISFLKTPNKVLAITEIPNCELNNLKGITLMLDKIQDPGNLGSIIRIADWFGITTICCSVETADAYSPKVVQSTMGSIFRTQIFYTSLSEILEKNPNKPSFAAVLNGKNVQEFSKITEGIIVIGNESKGISSEIISLCNHSVSIERKGNAESLNAAIATGIICHSLLN